MTVAVTYLLSKLYIKNSPISCLLLHLKNPKIPPTPEEPTYTSTLKESISIRNSPALEKSTYIENPTFYHLHEKYYPTYSEWKAMYDREVKDRKIST